MFKGYKAADRMISLGELIRRLRAHSTVSILSAGLLAAALCGLIIYTSVNDEMEAYAGTADVILSDDGMPVAGVEKMVERVVSEDAYAGEVRESLEEMQMALAFLTLDVNTGKETLEEIRAELPEGEGSNGAVGEEVEDALSDMSSKMSELGGDVSEAFREVAALYRMLEETDPKVVRAELNTRLDTLGGSIADLRIRREQADTQIAGIVETLSAAGGIGDDVESLLAMNRETRQQIQTLQSLNDTTSRQIDSLAAQSNTANEKISSLAEQSSATNEKISSLAEQSSTTNERISSLAEQSSATNEKISSLAEQSSATNEKISSLAEQSSAAGEKISSLAEQSSATNEKISSLTAQSSATSERLLDLKTQTEAASQQIGNLAEQTGQTQDAVAAVAARLDSIVTRLEAVEQGLARVEGNSGSVNKEMEKQLLGLEERLNHKLDTGFTAGGFPQEERDVLGEIKGIEIDIRNSVRSDVMDSLNRIWEKVSEQ